MASLNTAGIGLPTSSSDASNETPDQILANFQDIFSSQIEPDVVLLICTECDFNVNATLECLLALIGESPGSEYNKEQSDLHTSALNSKLNKTGSDSSTEKSIYKNRVSTIYKSNEGLYSEDVALNGEDLNQFSDFTPSFCASGRAANTQYSNCVDTIHSTHAEGLSLNFSKAGADSISLHCADQALKGTTFRKTLPKTKIVDAHQTGWNGVSDIRTLDQIQDPISPDSDKSIEADASEHIGIGIGQVKANGALISQPSVPNYSSLAHIDAMAGKQNKQSKLQQDSQFLQNLVGGHQKRPAIHRNPHAKNSPNVPGPGRPQMHSKWQPHQNRRPMSAKENVMMHIANGDKILVLMRGCPGSGKTTLAREIKFKGKILSADDYFMRNGKYHFDPSRLPEAHTHNKLLAMRAMRAGHTPIIIDNTNLLAWEMEPYVALAMQNQYHIYLLEPTTAWRYDPQQLAIKNTHNIGYDKIRMMLERFDKQVSVRSMIAQYCAINRSSNVKLSDIHAGGANTPNPLAKNQPRPRKKRKPKTIPQMPQVGVHADTSGGQPNTQDINSSDSDLDSDGWSVTSSIPQASFWDQPSPNNKLQKSKSIPNLMLPDDYRYNIKPENYPDSHNNSSFTYGLIDQSETPSNSAPEYEPKLSENMRDLMGVDFSTFYIPPENESDQFDATCRDSLPKDCGEVHQEKRRTGRLAAAFLDLPTDWDVPKYPSGVEDGVADTMPESRLTLSQEGLASSTSSLEQDVKKPENLSEYETPKINERNELSALKSFFPTVPDEHLKDFYDKCKGDLTWAVDLLLDAGYEMCLEKLSEDDFQKSGTSLEGLAEIGTDASDVVVSDGDAENVNGGCMGQSDQSSVTDVAIHDWQSKCVEKDDRMLLRIDPIFAMQLQEMFGPVGFHLSPALYYGSDLGMFIPTEVARRIHQCWADSMKAKFQSEDVEIVKMMESVVLDENYAKRLQEEEDHLLASELQSDPLGEQFPPLETKHILMTLENNDVKTEDLATRIKRRQLYEMFPKIDRKALDEVFNSNNASFSEAVQAVEVTFCPDQKPTMVIAPEQLEEYERALVKFAEQESLLLAMCPSKKSNDQVDESSCSEPTYDDWRTEATLHYRLRQECYSKAREAYDKGMMAAASFYSQQGQVHAKKLHEANKRASEKILESRNLNRKPDTLDLHMLHVNEAIDALTNFLDAKKQELREGGASQATLRIITGKGNHSALGMPRIKPAVLSFLAKQKYSHHESNGGLIEVTIRR